MFSDIKAVIFDMDGVIIDSEPLWRQAMIRSFCEIGIPFSDEHCRITTGLRFKEVAEYWFKKHNITHITVDEFDELVIERLCELIHIEGKTMSGVEEALRFFKEKGMKIGIGTSSNTKLMNTVVDVLNLRSYFDVLCSAEHMDYGKPHPQVYLTCSNELKVLPMHCLVIEDSVNGIVAGKAAQMKVLAIPEEINKNNPKFMIADYQMGSLMDVIQ
ncbi:MAG: haloacid dehalogenase superfamily protein subfamily variant 3 with third motif having or [Bacteroidota bacterium]|jgi:sugar-phosphatase|nr:haloacid dehalogenase superfamily protein subfamily variant 3 with third motif having or [Bacteroidota bacterium]